jgi:branched-chain amino acid transport system permease protein
MAVTIWSGLTLGAVYGLVALGFNLSLLPSGVINFAQGSIIVAGTYFTYAALTTAGLALVPTIVCNVLAGIALGVVCELVTVRPLRLRGGGGGGQQNELVTTVGMSTIIVGLVSVKWGDLPLTVPFHGPQGRVHALGVTAAPVEIILLVFAVAAAIGLHVCFHRTRLGQACLAVAEDRSAAMLRGINVNLLSLGGFAAAGALGTVSAMLIGPLTYALPTLANTIALYGFVAIALGGEGDFLGALLGGLLVGIVSSIATRYIGADYADLAVLALLLATLTLRPTGLGAATEMRHV